MKRMMGILASTPSLAELRYSLTFVRIMITAGTIFTKDDPIFKNSKTSYGKSNIHISLAECVTRQYIFLGPKMFSLVME